MSIENRMPARMLIGFKNKRFQIFPDEITAFLINCEDIGFITIADITEHLQLIANTSDDPKDLILLKEIILLLKGTIYEEK